MLVKGEKKCSIKSYIKSIKTKLGLSCDTLMLNKKLKMKSKFVVGVQLLVPVEGWVVGGRLGGWLVGQN